MKLKFICMILSCVFVLMQLMLLFFFEFNFKESQNDSLHENLIIFNKISTLYDIKFILVDINVLRLFVQNEINHRQYKSHARHRCEILCRNSSMQATFLVKDSEFRKLDNRFYDLLHHEGFHVDFDRDFDKREITLEKKHGMEKIIYHIFISKEETVIHIMVGYSRENVRESNLWCNSCSEEVLRNYLNLPLKDSYFCKQENIFINLQTTSAIVDNLKMTIPRYPTDFIDSIEQSHFVQCDYTEARQFYSKYGYDLTPNSNIFRENARKMLIKVSKILDNLNIPFWLSSGTCLGWFRQCDIIPHSKDIDIGIWIKFYKKDLIKAFLNQGFNLKHMFGKIEDSFELSFVLDDLKLDIFFFYEEKEYMWNGGTQVKSGKKFKYIFQKFSLCWTIFQNILVRVPCNTESYILSNYGSNWNVLIKEWDWKASPSNVHENGKWPEAEWKNLIQSF